VPTPFPGAAFLRRGALPPTFMVEPYAVWALAPGTAATDISISRGPLGALVFARVDGRSTTALTDRKLIVITLADPVATIRSSAR
jgi:hypothetical protein